jgi:uncharacterized protein (DUF58 family)
VALHQVTFPLVPRRRLIGLAFGAMHSARRGMGSDVAGSRPYRPGDDVDTIDWAASARLSSARASDEFIVRERFAEEAPRVVVLCDRRPEMALYPPGLPWLSKPAAMRAAAELISESTTQARGFIGYLDYAEVENPDPARRSAEPFWRAPRSQSELWGLKERHLAHPSFFAPRDNLTRAFDFLGQMRRSLPAGSFVFVCSDFLVSPSRESWLRALERRWDVAPVVIQDPVWEASFPDVASVVVPFADARSRRLRYARLTRAEARERRIENEQRRERLLADFAALGIDPILLDSSERDAVAAGFLRWAEHRASWRGRG